MEQEIEGSGWALNDHRRLRAAIVVMALLAAVAGCLLWTYWPRMVNARSTGQQAGAASPIPGNVRTYTLTQVTTWRTDLGESRMETQWWYQAPDRVRIEATKTGPGLTGEVHRVTVSDGVNTWEYDSGLELLQSHRSEPGLTIAPVVAEKGRKLESATLDGLLRLESACYSPSLKGTESVAGRPAYVLDLGPTRCPSNAAPEMNGRLVMWVDKESFFLLKWESYSPTDDNQVVGSLETTAIQ
ncbi:MAG: hypothetical protein ACM3XM_20385, partial [Mycobacterium leprae]